MVRFLETLIDPIIPLSSLIFTSNVFFRVKKYEDGKVVEGGEGGKYHFQGLYWTGLCCRSHFTGQEYSDYG